MEDGLTELPSFFWLKPDQSPKRVIPEADQQLAEFVKDRPNISTYRLFRNAATKQNLCRASLNEQHQQLSLV